MLTSAYKNGGKVAVWLRETRLGDDLTSASGVFAPVEARKTPPAKFAPLDRQKACEDAS